MPTIPKTKKKLDPNRDRKSRQTNAKEIKELATADIHAAMLLAEKGRKVAGIERQINLYLDSLKELRLIASGKKTPYQMGLELASILAQGQNLDTDGKFKSVVSTILTKVAKNNAWVHRLVERDRTRFCKMFIDALDTGDSQKFFEVGAALERLKTVDSGDPLRCAILELKRIAELTGTRLTLAEVAEYVNSRQTKLDGFSQLRDLCKELNYPCRSKRGDSVRRQDK